MLRFHLLVMNVTFQKGTFRRTTKGSKKRKTGPQSGEDMNFDIAPATWGPPECGGHAWLHSPCQGLQSGEDTDGSIPPAAPELGGMHLATKPLLFGGAMYGNTPSPHSSSQPNPTQTHIPPRYAGETSCRICPCKRTPASTLQTCTAFTS